MIPTPGGLPTWLLSLSPLLSLIVGVLGSGAALSILKAFLDFRANRTERHVALREAEILAKINEQSDAARHLRAILDARTMKWRIRLLRRGWLGMMFVGLALIGGGIYYLFRLDPRVAVIETIDRWDEPGITWNRFDTLVAIGVGAVGAGVTLAFISLCLWVWAHVKTSSEYGVIEVLRDAHATLQEELASRRRLKEDRSLPSPPAAQPGPPLD